MVSRHRGLRAELAAVLGVDQYSLTDVSGELPPPGEATSNHLSTLIARGVSHIEDARTVYEYLPIIMLRIFGYSTGQGWLETAAELPSRDREALLRIIVPGGPVHSFCRKHSPRRGDKIDLNKDMRFEFPRDNLPRATDTALESGSSSSLHRNMRLGLSFLAPLLTSSLREKEQVLLLTPIDYFYICMVASPTQKITIPPGSLPPGTKRPKRSTSLPSTRALFNQTLGTYAVSVDRAVRVGGDNIFIAACLDMLFLPWASAMPTTGLPEASTGTADAVASILLSLVPSSPSDLDLDIVSTSTGVGISDYIDPNIQNNTSAPYRAVENMLESVFRHYENGAPSGTLIAYIRVLALYIAPWKSSIRSALRKALYPKPRPANSAPTSKSPSIAAITSTLSSINASLGAASSRSPGNASSVRESNWHAELRRRRHTVDEELLRLAIVRAAHLRLSSTADGAKVLALLAEAVQAARLRYRWGDSDGDQDMAEELRGCLCALRDQKIEMERRSGQRERNYISTFASALNIQIDTGGVLSGMAEMVGVSGVNGVVGVVGLVSRSGGKSSASKRGLRERREAALHVSGHSNQDNKVPFLGNVWDRPITRGENEILVVASYWLALRLEPVLGFIPDIRFMGRYWVWVFMTFVAVLAFTLRALVVQSI